MQSATRTCTQSLGVAGVSIFSAVMDRTFLANPNVADRTVRSTCVLLTEQSGNANMFL